ncbi:hypothetical protein BJ170DRAFT_163075 [Xylariales sp. AK1849]|nr:hypothetical protein BJ170DRAFT_163075 [Xylariales sp. AK1849]
MSDLPKPDTRVSKIVKQCGALNDNGRSLNKLQSSLLSKAIELFEESDDSLAGRSHGQRRRRTKVRKFLHETTGLHGCEATLLCIITFSITQLYDDLSKLEGPLALWWKDFEKPIWLSVLAHRELDQYTRAGLQPSNVMIASDSPGTSHVPAISTPVTVTSQQSPSTHRKRSHSEVDASTSAQYPSKLRFSNLDDARSLLIDEDDSDEIGDDDETGDDNSIGQAENDSDDQVEANALDGQSSGMIPLAMGKFSVNHRCDFCLLRESPITRRNSI